eukprot:scaffold1241_cov32-Prasinocladus_malaysianus.AAC.3
MSFPGNVSVVCIGWNVCQFGCGVLCGKLHTDNSNPQNPRLIFTKLKAVFIGSGLLTNFGWGADCSCGLACRAVNFYATEQGLSMDNYDWIFAKRSQTALGPQICGFCFPRVKGISNSLSKLSAHGFCYPISFDM